MERVAIVGSRTWADPTLILSMVASLPRDTVIVSGGAKGVDTFAVSAAKQYGLMWIIVYPNWDAFGKAAGPLRNVVIVDISDRGIAFWDGKSRGTKNTIDLFNEAGKPIEIIMDK